jgi:hypothetical protein
MPDTIKIPGIGPTKSTYVYLGGAAIVGVVGYAYWRNRQSASAAATDPNATDTTALDSANAAAADPGTADYSAYGDGSGDAYGGAPIYQSPWNGNVPSPTGQPPSTNQDWDQYAYELLTDRGVEGTAASAALGRYLAGLCLSDAQAEIIRQVPLSPPQGTYHIQICAPAPGGGDGGGTKPGKVSGLHVTSHTKTTVGLQWSPVSGATHYRVYRTGAANNIGDSGSSTSFRVGGLRSNTTYTFHVRAWNGNVMGDASSSVKIKTSK